LGNERLHLERIRVLSLIEAHVITSPARIVLRFANDCREKVDLRIVNFLRGAHSPVNGYPNALVAEAAASGIPVSLVEDAAPYDFRTIFKLKQLIREYRPHIVQTNSIKSHFLISLAGRRSFGWVAFHHGYTAENFKMRAYNELDRWSLRACDQVVTVCNAFAAELVRKGVPRRKIRVIPNGIPRDFLTRDVKVVSEWRAHFGVEPGEKVVLSAGRLSPEKGHRFLIDAVARMLATGCAPRFKVLIAGTGLLEQDLRRQISDLGVTGTVKLIGFQPDIKLLYQIADIFVLPSLSEGSPMVLLESMISRIPVVTTKVGGIPETVADGETGLVVPPANPEALAEALNSLLANPERAAKLSEAAYIRARDCYSPELYNSRVIAAFEDILQQKQASGTPGAEVAR
jgi:glycosyltransferase involved in cell wall biosynthesis